MEKDKIDGIATTYLDRVADDPSAAGPVPPTQAQEEMAAAEEEGVVLARPARQPSAYNLFMKAKLLKIKQSHPQMHHSQAFSMAAKAWNAQKSEAQRDPQLPPGGCTSLVNAAPASSASAAFVPRFSPEEHDRLAQRLEEHMAATGLTQVAVAAAALNFKTGARLSVWLRGGQMSVEVRDRIDGLIAAYLDSPAAADAAAAAAAATAAATAGTTSIIPSGHKRDLLVQRLKEHMAATGLSQKAVAEAAKVSSASSWDEIDQLMTTYLERHPHNGAVPEAVAAAPSVGPSVASLPQADQTSLSQSDQTAESSVLSAMLARRDSKVICEGCGRVFTSIHGLNAHLRFCRGGGDDGSSKDEFDNGEHEGVAGCGSEAICEGCGRVFASKHGLNAHLRFCDPLGPQTNAALPETGPIETMLPDGSYMVSHLVAERHVPKRQFKGEWLTKHQFRVRWVGYSSADDTWEDESSILTPVLITNFERLRDEAGGDVRTATRMELDSMGIEIQSGRVEDELGAGCAAWLRHSGAMSAASITSAEERAWQWLDACWNQRGQKATRRDAMSDSNDEPHRQRWQQQQQPPVKRSKLEHQGRPQVSVLQAPSLAEQGALARLTSKLQQAGGTADLLDGWSAACRESHHRRYVVYHSPDGRRFDSCPEVLRHLGFVGDASRMSSSKWSRTAGATERRDFWVSCDRCKKWRRLHVRTAVPAVWFCELNPDPLYDDCSHEQEEYDTEEEDAGEEEAQEEAAPLMERETATEEGAEEKREEVVEEAPLVERETATEEGAD
jgi:hypothetical protein